MCKLKHPHCNVMKELGSDLKVGSGTPFILPVD